GSTWPRSTNIQNPHQLATRTDVELREDVAQVPLDGARAEEEPGADLGVGQAVAGEPRDLPLLRRQLVVRLDRSPNLLARRLELLAGALSERLHPERGEDGVAGAQLLARFQAAVLAPQPLAVDQVCTAQLRAQAGAGEALDRVAVAVVGGRSAAEQR